MNGSVFSLCPAVVKTCESFLTYRKARYDVWRIRSSYADRLPDAAAPPTMSKTGPTRSVEVFRIVLELVPLELWRYYSSYL
jgi:hypothetical protein